MKRQDHTVVILHGWGLSGDRYSELQSCLEKKGYRVFSPDFPGFGKKTAAKTSMTLSDFTDFYKEFLEKKKIKEHIIVGHSFGGRVGVKYTSMNNENVELLILTGVPIIRHYGIKQRISFVIAKTLKIPFVILPSSWANYSRKGLYRIIGEYDYVKSGEKKSTFKNIINESLIPCFQLITAPVVLIWGELDRLTPVSDLDKIQKIKPVQHAKKVKGFGHSLPYQDPKQFAELVDSYILKYA